MGLCNMAEDMEDIRATLHRDRSEQLHLLKQQHQMDACS